MYHNEIDHAYGPNIHILGDPILNGFLASVCEEKTVQPRINGLVRDLYRNLLKAVLNTEFPTEEVEVRTRMAAVSEHGIWRGAVIKRATPTVTVNILRAGSVPSEICFDTLNRVLDPSTVRQDHVVMSRITDSEGRVCGSHFGDSKIGGSVDNAFVLFPDPMGATGISMSKAISHYKENVPGKARRYIALHLIITPEYIKRMKQDHPDVLIYAIRLDRGASPMDVLQEKPGVRIDEESGLTDKQYIVPGGGGFGEIMNNSYC